MKQSIKKRKIDEIERLEGLIQEKNIDRSEKDKIVMTGFENDVMSAAIVEVSKYEAYQIVRFHKRFMKGKKVFFKSKTKLSEDEEKKLILIIQKRFEGNKLTTIDKLLKICEKIVKKRGEEGKISFSKKFYESFLMRHKDLKLTLIQHVDYQKMRAAHIENLKPFISLWNSLLSSRKYSPHLIFNYDETMLQLNFSGKSINCIVPEGMKEKNKLSKNISTKHNTLGFCSSSSGLKVKPLFIYPSTKEILDFSSPFFPWYPKFSKSGWINNEILIDYFKNIFIPKVFKIREKLNDIKAPCMLLMDGHSTRKNFEFRTLLRQHNIDLVILPANTTSFLQPLDSSVNSSFKASLFRNLSSTEDKYEGETFSSKSRDYLIKELPDLIYSSHSPNIIKAGWKQTKLNGVLSEEILLRIGLIKQSSSMAQYHPIRQKKNSISGKLIN